MDFLSKSSNFSLLFLVPLAANLEKVHETSWFWLTSFFSKTFILNVGVKTLGFTDGVAPRVFDGKPRPV
jgi:hypothetical protein